MKTTNTTSKTQPDSFKLLILSSPTMDSPNKSEDIPSSPNLIDPPPKRDQERSENDRSVESEIVEVESKLNEPEIPSQDSESLSEKTLHRHT